MTQINQPPQPGRTVDTPVGAQWPAQPASPGSTDFGSATVVSDLSSRGETISGQPVEDAHLRTTVDADHHGTTHGVHVVERVRSRPSAAAVIGSAMLGAVAGTAIPFMLAGRKQEGELKSALRPYSSAAPDRIDRDRPWERSWR